MRDAFEAFTDRRQHVGIDSNFLSRRRLELLAHRSILPIDRPANVWLHKRSTVGNEGVEARNLEWSHLEIALSN